MTKAARKPAQDPVTQEPTAADVAENIVVQNLGDATEDKARLSPPAGQPTLLPMSKLPPGYETLTRTYPTAKGYRMEGGAVAVYF
ncbi:MAG: hypothetical protein LCH89_00325 [Proteobacteria bacterium]|nr:hypothetical protein [Pseudomonadota bacterium]